MTSQSSATVLLVEDEAAVRELLAFHLGRAGFSVLEAASTAEADGLAAEADIIILDRMLPGESGTSWLQRQRELQPGSAPRTPVLMLTARATEADKVDGLESGADDYLTKPFSNAELIARLRALLRRTGRPDTVTAGPLTIRSDEGIAELDGKLLELTRREFDLLSYLTANAGRVCSRSELLDHVWGEEFMGTDRTVDQHVAQLRALLGSGWIRTVRGRGYRLSPPEDDAA